MRAILNHLLKQQPHLAAQLQACAGQQIALNIFSIHTQSTITPEGYLTTPTAAEADAHIRIHASIVPALLQKQTPASGQIEILGDATLGAAFARVLQQLNWDTADDLSPLVGDIAAQRIVKTCQAIFTWHKESAVRASQSVADYAQHEAAWLPAPAQVDGFCRAVDSLRDDIARLQKRLQNLEKKQVEAQDLPPLPVKDAPCA